ncbi:TolC family protein [Paracoccus contaminans]|uniref:Transporter n=1 Tax=Paracoccus contaminans TaxID=1945662 RepID=A0A1W6CXY0_9RHOB|nr:TolC family protein [Paracoccus contaminans]ARJ69712.1 hypothetical protein B0A89_08845 [Paracoccus contaminans]
MKLFPALTLSAALLCSACAALPELDGKPVTAQRLADFQLASAPVWTMDFGDGGLRRMLAEADAAGLDAASARARFRAADLALDQARADRGLGHSADGSAERTSLALNASLRFEPDLAGKFEAALRAAMLEHSASGLDLLIARRTLAREVTQGWVALAEARTEAARASGDIAAEERSLSLLRLRRAAGEITGTDIAAREQALVRARADAAGASGRTALAEARLRALGVRTIPPAIALKGAARPKVPARTDLAATQAVPGVYAAWLRFHAADASRADASRAEALAASRPRLVVTSSIAATARTLAGLVAGNGAAVTNAVRLEGAILDNGAARRNLDKARLSVAQAEIDWLRARNQSEIAALEAVTARQTAEAGLDAALSGWKNASADLARVRARQVAGEADALELAEAERAVATAQRDIDRARAEAFRAAAALNDALPPPVAGCAAAAGAPTAPAI